MNPKRIIGGCIQWIDYESDAADFDKLFMISFFDGGEEKEVNYVRKLKLCQKVK